MSRRPGKLSLYHMLTSPVAGQISRYFEKFVNLAIFKVGFIHIAMTEFFNSFSDVTMVQWKHNIKN